MQPNFVHRGTMQVLDRHSLEQAYCECYAVVKEHFDAIVLPPELKALEINRQETREGGGAFSKEVPPWHLQAILAIPSEVRCVKQSIACLFQPKAKALSRLQSSCPPGLLAKRSRLVCSRFSAAIPPPRS